MKTKIKSFLKKAVAVVLSAATVVGTGSMNIGALSTSIVADTAAEANVGSELYRLFQATKYSEDFSKAFVGTDSSSYARDFYNGLSTDKSFINSVNAWETLHIATSPSYSLESGMITKFDYYKTVLFDLLTQKEDSSYIAQIGSEYNSLLNKVKNEQSSFIVSISAQISEKEDVPIDQLKSVENFDKSFMERVASKVCDSLSVAKDVMELLSTCQNAAEAIELVATYATLADYNDGTKEVLTYIANDTNNPSDLREAAKSCLLCFDNSFKSTLMALSCCLNTL